MSDENKGIIKYITDTKDKIISISLILNKDNIKFYLTYFIIFFFLYFTLTSKYVNSSFEDLYNRKKDDIKFLIFYYGGLGLTFLAWCYYYYTNIENLLNEEIRLKIIVSGIFVIFLFFNFMQVFLKYISNYLPDLVLRILLYLFLLFNIVFFIFYITLFILNVNKEYNIENCIAMEILLFFYFINSSNIYHNKSTIYDKLSKNDFNYLSINCISSNIKDEETKSIQLDTIGKENGNDYLQLKYNIPIKYKNSKTEQYEDLLLCDFYYPGSYKTYLADSPLNGTPDLYAIEKALTHFKVRIITLDIYSDIDNEYSEDANPVVRSEILKKGASPLNLNDCFKTINDFAWIPNNNNDISYPLFLILDFNFDDSNYGLFAKIKEMIYNNFSKYLIDQKYGYNGYGKNFISMAKIEECLGKIIIITNKYPAGPLNELINCSYKKGTGNNSLTMHEYKARFVDFNGIGVSQDYSKTELFNTCKSNIMLFYTTVNKDYENVEQSKAGLFNPRFKDLGQYGIQGTLMNLFIPDNNLNDWYLYFNNKSNFDPVLKSEKLRDIDIQKDDEKGQNPVVGIKPSQKYCLMGNNEFMTTNKSNLSTGETNNSCQSK